MPDHASFDPHADYIPVVVPYRHDGWTAEKQRNFLLVLAETGCVSEACGFVDMSQRSAYALRRKANGGAFARAWDRAIAASAGRLTAIAYERVIHGTEREVWHKGQMVGVERRYNDRMLMFLINHAAQQTGWSDIDSLPVPQEVAQATLPELLEDLVDDNAPVEHNRFPRMV